MNCQMGQDKSRFRVTAKGISQGTIIFHRFLSFSSNYLFFKVSIGNTYCFYNNKIYLFLKKGKGSPI